MNISQYSSFKLPSKPFATAQLINAFDEELEDLYLSESRSFEVLCTQMFALMPPA